MYNCYTMIEQKQEQQNNEVFDDYVKSLDEETNLPSISDQVVNDLNDFSYIREDEKAQRGTTYRKVLIALAIVFLLVAGTFSILNNRKEVPTVEEIPQEVIDVNEEEDIEDYEVFEEEDINDVFNASGLPIDISNMTLPVQYKNLTLRSFFLENGSIVEDIKEVGNKEVNLSIVDKDGRKVGNITLISRSGEVVPINDAIVTKIDMDFETLIENMDIDEDVPSFMLTMIMDQFLNMDDFGFQKEETSTGSDYVIYMNSKDVDYMYSKLTLHKNMGIYNKITIEAVNDK